MTFQTAIADYLLHCKLEKNLSLKTLKAYQTDLLQFKRFLILDKGQADLEAITKAEIREYLSTIATLKPKSIKRKLASLKALFNYMEFEDTLAVNPFRKMRIKLREEKKLPAVLNIREIINMLKTAYKYRQKVKQTGTYAYLEATRNIIVLELLFNTGGRVSEVANLKKTDVSLETGSVLFRGKGNKERVIHVCNRETLDVLKTYQGLCKNYSGEYLLINRFNKKLSDQSIRTIVKSHSLKAGINRRITPHAFRHSFATLLLEKDVDIKYIQSLLGHSSIVTTQIYTHVNRFKQKQILKTKHPRKDFSMALEEVE